MQMKLIPSQGSKAELHNRLQLLREKHADTIEKNKINIVQEGDKYNVTAKKLWFHFDGYITVDDGSYTITYDSNVPDHYIEQGMSTFLEELKSV